MFDPFEVPQETTTSYSAQSSSKALSDEEIALKLVEMFVRESNTRSIDTVINHYFYALDKLKNRQSPQEESSGETPSYFKDDEDEDILSGKEYTSDEQVSFDPSDII